MGFKDAGGPEDQLTQLKADRPHPRDYPHMPTNFRDRDKHLRLVLRSVVGMAHVLRSTNGSGVYSSSTDGQTDRRTDRRTDGRMLPILLSPSLRGR